jgi:alpha-mannosidase
MPLLLVPGEVPPLFGLEDDNLVLDTVKKAEDGDDLVLRLYEAHGARGLARLRVGLPFTRARLVNLLEEDLPGGDLAVAGDEVLLPYLPHRIVTVRLS